MSSFVIFLLLNSLQRKLFQHESFLCGIAHRDVEVEAVLDYDAVSLTLYRCC